MLLLFSVLFLNSPPLPADVNAFKHFKKDGNEQYCMVDYTAREIHCIYDSREDCGNHYDQRHAQICFSRKSLKLGDDK